MTKVNKTLASLRDALEMEVERRERTFDERSEKWQESEKGEEFMERTELFQEMLDTVCDWQDELEEI